MNFKKTHPNQIILESELPQKMFDIFLKIYLIGSMLFYWPGMMAYEPQEMFIQYSAMVFFALSFFVPAKRRISNVFLGLFLMYSMINTFALSFNPPSRLVLMNIFLGLLTLKILAERIDFNFRKIGILLLCFLVVNMGEMALQFFQKDPIFSSVNPEAMPQVDVVGFMSIRFALGILAAFSIPFLFSIHWSVCSLALPLIYFSKASTPALACVVAFLYLMYFENKKLFWTFLALGLAAIVYYVGFYDAPSGQFSKRIHVWFAGIKMLTQKPYFGWGLGAWNGLNIVTIQENGQPEKWAWAHNDFLQLAFEQGIIACVILYAYLKDFFKKIVFSPEGRVIFSLLIVLMIVSTFHFPFHIGRFAGFSIYILALMEAHTSRRSNEETINLI